MRNLKDYNDVIRKMTHGCSLFPLLTGLFKTCSPSTSNRFLSQVQTMVTFADLQALDVSLSRLGNMIEHEGIVRVQESRDRSASHQAEVLETITGQLGQLNCSVTQFVDTYREARGLMTEFMQIQSKLNAEARKPLKTVKVYSPPPPSLITELIIPVAPVPITIQFNSDSRDGYDIIVTGVVHSQKTCPSSVKLIRWS